MTTGADGAERCWRSRTALKQAIAAGGVAAYRRARTLTFIWGDENRGSHAWLVAHPDQARGVQYMLSMDMTGEDTSKTGGDVPHREAAGSIRGVAGSVRSTHRMGRERGETGGVEGQL